MIQIQESIGQGSMGLVYRAVAPADLTALVAQCAAGTGQTIETVSAKLARGYTMWLDKAAGHKIRGFDSAVAATQALARETTRVSRVAADGYFDHQ